MTTSDKQFSSRAGDKLAFGLKEFNINPEGLICADLGCSTGGFTSCLIQNGALKVYAVDTGYGVLDYKLRIDHRIVVMERTNALHVKLPELVDFISIDVGWTPQHLIIPAAIKLLKNSGVIISLLKPHYEAQNAHLSESESEQIAESIVEKLKFNNINVLNVIKSPIVGEKAGNTEYLILVKA